MKKTITALALATIMLNSCATILDGSKTRVVVTGNVPATITYNGETVGHTSARKNVLKETINSTANTDLNTSTRIKDKIRIRKSSLKAGGKMEIKAEGYETQTVEMYRRIRPGFLLMDIFPGVGVGLVVDLVTGNIYGVKPKVVNYELIKK